MEDKERRQKQKKDQSMEKRRGTKNREEINTRVGSTEHADLKKSSQWRANHEKPRTDKKAEEISRTIKEECQGMNRDEGQKKEKRYIHRRNLIHNIM